MTGPLQFPFKLEISLQVEAILKKSHEHNIFFLSSSLPLAPKTFHFSIVHLYFVLVSLQLLESRYIPTVLVQLIQKI